MPTKHLVKSLKEINSVYLSNIDSEQIAGLIERIKKELKRKPEPPKPSSKPENSKKNESSVKPSSKPAEKTGNQPGGKVSSVDKFRKMLGNLGISDSDESSSDEVDFCAVEKSFQNGSDTD
jgi:predicted Zn-dependent peptidase